MAKGWRTIEWVEVARIVARVLLAAAYAGAGVLHLMSPEPFLSITPGWVPWPEQVIRWTGVAEIAGAVGLFIPRFRKAAGVGLALYAVCVFPANVNHALMAWEGGTWAATQSYHVPRLLFQPVIVWWALWVGQVIDWPFGRGRKRQEKPA